MKMKVTIHRKLNWIRNLNMRIREYKLISKIIESSKINMSSNFESENVESIPKVVESSKI
jgi:hypothetical protein